MQGLKRLIPLGISLIVTPFALAIGLASAVEGDLFYTKLIFPCTSIFVGFVRMAYSDSHGPDFDRTFGILFWGLSIIQFPIYGTILSLVEDRPPVILKLLGIHVCGSVVSFLLFFLMNLT